MKVAPSAVFRIIEYSPLGFVPGVFRIVTALSGTDSEIRKLANAHLKFQNTNTTLQLLRGAVSIFPIINAVILIPIDIGSAVFKLAKTKVEERPIHHNEKTLNNAKDALQTILDYKNFVHTDAAETRKAIKEALKYLPYEKVTDNMQDFPEEFSRNHFLTALNICDELIGFEKDDDKSISKIVRGEEGSFSFLVTSSQSKYLRNHLETALNDITQMIDKEEVIEV